MSIEQWQDHFRAEAKRILKQFERSDPIIEPETVEAIEELYAGMPEQLRERKANGTVVPSFPTPKSQT
jgi:hypothetical protein